MKIFKMKNIIKTLALTGLGILSTAGVAKNQGLATLTDVPQDALDPNELNDEIRIKANTDTSLVSKYKWEEKMYNLLGKLYDGTYQRIIVEDETGAPIDTIQIYNSNGDNK